MNEENKIFAGPRPYAVNPAKKGTARNLKQPRQWRWFLKLSLGFILICVLVYGWFKLTDPETFPIHSVKIAGTYSHIDQEKLRATILPFIRKGFLVIDTASLQDRIQQLPWVYSANVHRVWPDILMIGLVEQQPIARYNDNALLNKYGEVFNIDPASMPTNLPLFIAPPGQQVLLWQTYQKLSALIAPLDLKINILGLDARQSWRLQLSNGIVLLLGKLAPEQRLARFVAAYPQVVGTRSAAINYVDLRYTHGMAVGFKQ
jgi:cell division protein FtsQ